MDKIHKYVNCIAHNSSEGNLLIGDDFTALIDCGMQFCAATTIQNVKNALGNRTLDYIFATHTHYDHIGALPQFRQAFPNVKLVTTEIGAAVLAKDTPRRVIRELSGTAARDFGGDFDGSYSDDAFFADIIVKEGYVVDLGEISIEVIETPGHTRDSLSFYIPELELLILSETTGVLFPAGTMYPCYLTGFADAANAIEKCRKYPYKHISLPHRGLVSPESVAGYFKRAEKLVGECREFVLDMHKRGLEESEMVDLFFEKFGSEELLRYQPKAAFDANAYATIACVIREENAKQ